MPADFVPEAQAFDDDRGIRPQFHTYVDAGAPWDSITEGLPEYGVAWKP